MGIASWIVKKKISSAYAMMNQDDYNVDALMAGFAEDAIWDAASDFSVGGSIRGRKAIAEWFHQWKKEFPKRRVVVKNICMKGTCMPSPSNMVMVDWTCREVDKQGKEFQYDGVSVITIRNRKIVHQSEYISFKGLPQLASLIRPAAKA